MTHTTNAVQLVANILLGDAALPDIGALFARALPAGSQIFSQDETHLFAKISGSQADNNSMEGLDIVIAYVPMPVAFDAGDLERNVRSNLLTQNMPLATLEGHRSHIKIILKTPHDGAPTDSQAMARALMTLVVSGCAQVDALAVHWAAANSIQHAKIFAGIAPILPSLPPLSQTTLALRVIMFQPGQHTLTTEGLAFHVGYELGMDVSTRLDNACIRDFLAVADYIIATKPTLKHGDTMGVGDTGNGPAWKISDRSFQGQHFLCLTSKS